MATVASFPDQGHLDMIRQRPWSVREFGRAAVMVGAGFSRQALAASPSVGRLPSYNRKLWMKRKGDVPFWGKFWKSTPGPGATRGERYATNVGAYHCERGAGGAGA